MIENNIPIPAQRKKYDLSPMSVGASSFYSFNETNVKDLRPTLLSSALWQNKGGKYRTSKVIENGISGIRIWRVE